MFYDTEQDDYINTNELLKEYEYLKKSNETEATNFKMYLDNCLEGNGFLQVVKNYTQI